jgi:hypothetical protein
VSRPNPCAAGCRIRRRKKSSAERLPPDAALGVNSLTTQCSEGRASPMYSVCG